MKILLINPPFYRIIGFYNRYFPYGLATNDTAIKEAGHDVSVYNSELYKSSENILSKIYKGITINQGRYAARVLRKSGIRWSTYFLIGHLGETKKDIYRTLGFMHELKSDLAFLCVYENFPGTKVFQESIEKNIVNPDMSLEDFYTPPPNLYYLKTPDIRNDVIYLKEYQLIEKDIKEQFHKYNKNLRNIFRMAMAKFSVYVQEPRILYENI